MSKPTVSMNQTRTMTLEGKRENRSVTASLSSETMVDKIFGKEILVHDQGAIDMSRAINGLPLLANHNKGALPIGRVQNVHLGNDKKLRGTLQFSDATQEARDAWALVEDGTLTDLSISYRILDYEQQRNKEGGDVYSVTKWLPFEASVVTIPADSDVGIGRSLEITDSVPQPEDPEMDKPNIENGAGGGANVSILDEVNERTQAGFAAGQRAEQARLTAIDTAERSLCTALPTIADRIQALATHCRSDTTITSESFNAHALKLIGSNDEPLAVSVPTSQGRAFSVPGDARRGIVEAGESENRRFFEGVTKALLEKGGGKIDPKEMEGNQYRGWSMIDIADTSLKLAGVDTRGMSREQIAKRAIGMSGMRAVEGGAANYVTSDFPAVTANVATKMVFQGFEEADRTWDQWCSVGSAPDFKTFDVPRLSAYSSLPIVAENATYTQGTLLDAKETGTLAKRGSLLSLSWEATVNDDASLFSRNAMRLGESAQRTIDETVYAALVSNAKLGPVMGDTNNLFDAANHANKGTDALDLDGIIATRVAMGRQTDENSVLLGIRMAKVLVPLELQDAAVNLATADNLGVVVGTDAGVQRNNTVRGTFDVVATARLTDANDWFGLARTGQACEVVFLNGNRAPSVEQEPGWSYDTLEWKVRIVHAVVFPDWRGLYSQVVA